MSLSTYHKKRKFSKTPEPKGKVEESRGPLRFVIQKHEATRLHYDFRLELDGVLKSWAVPKGPSLNPEDRHLAVMVEDHPLDYAKFEGIIPKGNYGGGTVMIWDQGVYTPLQTVNRKDTEKILREQLEKGHLTFIMLGDKLKGEFALIKTKSDEESTWLLIKKGDEFASKKDVTKEDKSVVTGRTMDQIAQQAERKREVWMGKPKDIDINAPKHEMPKTISPMLAKTIDEPFDKPNWFFEVKFDGYRTLAFIDAGQVTLKSRNNISYGEKFEKIAMSLQKFPTSAILDGEVVVLDKSGHPKFQWLQDYPKTRQGELVYFVFDILYYDGKSTIKLPLRERKELLEKVLPTLSGIKYSDHIEEHGIAFFKEANKLKIEGVVAKNAESTYHEGVRSDEWLKIKTINRQEAIIAGFTKPKGGRKYFGALVLGVYKKNKLHYIGHTGGGFDDKDLVSIHKKLTAIRQDENPFGQAIETNAPVTWVKPQLLCEVSFSEWTKDQIMRHPIFIGLREDKNPKEVKKETVKHVIARSVATRQSPNTSFSRRRESQTLESKGLDDKKEIIVNKQKLTISNKSKVFWPKEGYTKGDLIEYYKSVAKILLPHLIDRPQSLLRYPNGITGQSFFQKNVGELVPSWIKTKRVKSENHDITYMLCQDEESLLYMINLGCIDLNPWNSRVGSLDNPDYLVIDLDPEKTSFEKVVKVAEYVREVLEDLEITGYPKTSGAKGIHVYIPLEAKYDYDTVRHFTELLCIEVHKKCPTLSSMLRSPNKREGKVYLDFLQNRKGQTLASVYSVRAKPGATVSTPLEWKELTSKLTPDQFTIKNTLKRIEKHGDIFRPSLGKGISIEKTFKKLSAIL